MATVHFLFETKLWEQLKILQQISGCQGQKEEENRECLLNGYKVSFWGDENVLELESSDGCTAL